MFPKNWKQQLAGKTAPHVFFSFSVVCVGVSMCLLLASPVQNRGNLIILMISCKNTERQSPVSERGLTRNASCTQRHRYKFESKESYSSSLFLPGIDRKCMKLCVCDGVEDPALPTSRQLGWALPIPFLFRQTHQTLMAKRVITAACARVNKHHQKHHLDALRCENKYESTVRPFLHVAFSVCFFRCPLPGSVASSPLLLSAPVQGTKKRKKGNKKRWSYWLRVKRVRTPHAA